MKDAVSKETSLTAASEPNRKPRARKGYCPSGGVKGEEGSTANAGRLIRDPAATTLATVPNAGPMTAEALLRDYPAPASPDGSEPHCNGTQASPWLNWPKRCERALLRYLSAQEGHSFALDLARGEVEEMEAPERSSIESSVQHGASAAA